MRRECLDCVRKHVGSALAVIPELFTDYPAHITRAVGELDQAYQESLRYYTHLAREIRQFRLSVEGAYERLLAGDAPADVAAGMLLDDDLVMLIHEEYIRLSTASSAEQDNPEKV